MAPLLSLSQQLEVVEKTTMKNNLWLLIMKVNLIKDIFIFGSMFKIIYDKLVEIKNVGQCVIVLVKNVIPTTMGDWFLQAQWATLYFPKSLMKGSKHGWLSYTPNWQTTNLLWERYNFKLFSFIPSIHSINYVLQFSCLIIESIYFFQVVGILYVLNLTTILFQKLCVKCHAIDIVVSTTNHNKWWCQL